MNIGFYLNSDHLGAWSLTSDPANDEGFNGTDSTFLAVAAHCPSLGHRTTLYCTTPPANSSAVELTQVSDLAAAVRACHADGGDALVFNYKEKDEFFAGLAAAEDCGVKCIVWDQNGPTPKTRPLYASLTCVRRLVCVSHFQALTTSDSPLNPKVAVLWNGIDTAFWQPPESPARERLVVYLGALVETKGFHHLAAAWPAIRANVPDARLAVIGSAKLYDKGARLGSLGVSTPDFEAKFTPFLGADPAALAAKGVSFLGLLDKAAIRSLLHEASVAVINPNVTGSLECCSVGSLESMAAGTPVVGGNGGGLRETIFHRQTGFLANDSAALASFASQLLSDVALRDKMSKNSVRVASETFSREAFQARWQLLFSTLDQRVPATLQPRFQSNPSLNAAARLCIRAVKQLGGRSRSRFVLENLKPAPASA